LRGEGQGEGDMEKMLSKDEVERIAKDYVVLKEDVGDVEISEIQLDSGEMEPLIHKVQGIARRHLMKHNIDYILSECHFTLLISNRDGKIRNYIPNEWFYHYSVHDLQQED
jgi:hypothetical protein